MPVTILTRVRKGVTERKCTRCEMWFPLDRFEKSSECINGRTGECRLCRAERRARYAAESKEKAHG